jgi:hypothetical protein
MLSGESDHALPTVHFSFIHFPIPSNKTPEPFGFLWCPMAKIAIALIAGWLALGALAIGWLLARATAL